MSNPHWHTWAVLSARFNWRTGQVERKVVSTHKARTTAQRRAKKVEHAMIARSAHLYHTKIGDWLAA